MTSLQQIPLFAIENAALKSPFDLGIAPADFILEGETEEKIEGVIEHLYDRLSNGFAFAIGSSFGKDSSVLLALTLEAARRYRGDHGNCPDIVVLHSDTGLESPVMWAYAKEEIANVRQFAKQHDLPVIVEVAKPGISEDYLVSLIGGRRIASTTNGDASCSVDMKVKPMQRLQKKLFKQMKRNYGDKIITCTGKRWSESTQRRLDMEAAGEVPWEPVERNGQNMMPAIAHFTYDDVLYFLGLVTSGLFSTYSNFERLVDIYRGSMDGVCLVNAVEGKASKSGCSTRFGCHICLRVATDSSIENMLKQDEFAFMKPLNDFRNYIGYRHNDPKARTWLARSVAEDGSIAISPSAYSPEFCEELLMMALSIQADEFEWAFQNDTQPRFYLLSTEQLMNIELLWMRYGFHRSFEAHRILKRIEAGERVYPPTEISKDNLPSLKSTNTRVPFVDAQFVGTFNGLRDQMLATMDQEELVEKDGKVYADVVADGFHIDSEAVALFHEFEIDKYIDSYGTEMTPSSALQALLRLGIISLPKGSHKMYDNMLRIGNQIHNLGLRGILNDPDALLKRLGGE